MDMVLDGAFTVPVYYCVFRRRKPELEFEYSDDDDDDDENRGVSN